jgi:hypothetical protein
LSIFECRNVTGKSTSFRYRVLSTFHIIACCIFMKFGHNKIWHVPKKKSLFFWKHIKFLEGSSSITNLPIYLCLTSYFIPFGHHHLSYDTYCNVITMGQFYFKRSDISHLNLFFSSSFLQMKLFYIIFYSFSCSCCWIWLTTFKNEQWERVWINSVHW